MDYPYLLFTKLGVTINNSNNRKLYYDHLIKYYSLLQNWQKPSTVEIYRSINLACLLLRTLFGRSIAKQLWQSFTTSIAYSQF